MAFKGKVILSQVIELIFVVYFRLNINLLAFLLLIDNKNKRLHCKFCKESEEVAYLLRVTSF